MQKNLLFIEDLFEIFYKGNYCPLTYPFCKFIFYLSGLLKSSLTVKTPLPAKSSRGLKNEFRSSPTFRNRDGSHRKWLGEAEWGP